MTRPTLVPMNCMAHKHDMGISPGARKEIKRITDIWSRCRSENAASGPWLFGRFSVADVMFTPVASRFQTYGVELGPSANEYRNIVLSHPDVERWYADSRQETEVLDICD